MERAIAPYSLPFVMTAFEMPGGVPLQINLGNHWYSLMPNEAVEIPEGQFYCDKLIEQYSPVYGIIQVPTVRTRTGISIDEDAAIASAKAKLDEIEETLVLNWVRRMQEERIKEGKPCLPPSGRVKDIIAQRKIDLKARFNLEPVGFEPVGGRAPSKGDSRRQEALEKENADLRRQVEEQAEAQAGLDARLQAIENSLTAKK